MFAIVDTETTGFSRTDRVIEVGVAICDEQGNLTGSWGTLIDPGPGVSPGATDIHGITRDMLDGAPTFEEVSGFLCGVLAGRLFSAHNAPFDSRMLATEFARLGLEVPIGKTQHLCTMQASKNLWPGHSSYKLGDLCPKLGIDLTDAHEALADAEATAALLHVMIAEGLNVDSLLDAAHTAPWPHPPQLPMTPLRRHDASARRLLAMAGVTDV